MKKREIYNGLTTKKRAVACSPIMATSSTKIKVKTVDASTNPWEEEKVEESLPTSISKDISF